MYCFFFHEMAQPTLEVITAEWVLCLLNTSQPLRTCGSLSLCVDLLLLSLKAVWEKKKKTAIKLSYASHSKLHLRLYLFWQILPQKCNKLSFRGISIQARCNPNEDDDDAMCGFLCTAGLDTLRGSSCLWRLRGQGWCVWPWKQRSLHKSIDPMGIWACHHFFPRWVKDDVMTS